MQEARCLTGNKKGSDSTEPGRMYESLIALSKGVFTSHQKQFKNTEARNNNEATSTL